MATRHRVNSTTSVIHLLGVQATHRWMLHTQQLNRYTQLSRMRQRTHRFTVACVRRKPSLFVLRCMHYLNSPPAIQCTLLILWGLESRSDSISAKPASPRESTWYHLRGATTTSSRACLVLRHNSGGRLWHETESAEVIDTQYMPRDDSSRPVSGCYR